jgi:N-acetyl-alpha-D-glucosaminyl L-malate synthase BshA
MNDGCPPVITTCHGSDITLVGSHPAYAPVVKFTLDRSDAVTTVSKFLADETCASINYCGDIKVVYNFVDTSVYSRKCSRIPKSIFSTDGEPLIIHISNFRPVKRVTDVVKTFIEVRKQKKCRLLLAGDGPERSSAETLAYSAGVTNDVIFLGKQTAIVDLLGISDIMLQPSETESFGLSLLEGMACEIPVIATRVGGVPEVVKDGECGYLTEVGDTDQMAARILQLLNDPDQAQAMGRAGRNRANELFHQDKIVAQYEALYEEVLGRPPCHEFPSMSSKSAMT